MFRSALRWQPTGCSHSWASRVEAGFTVAELMVVVVIIGVLAAMATPYVARDRRASAGREFASGLVRELQRVRIQALSERVPIRAYVFSNRVELRSWVAGATLGDPPQAPTAADPLLRTIPTLAGVDVLDVLTTSSPPPATQQLTAASSVLLDFNSQGQMQFVGQAPMTSAFVFIQNSSVRSNHSEASHRIDIRSLTGYVAMRAGWN